jgi:hypothetical protein
VVCRVSGASVILMFVDVVLFGERCRRKCGLPDKEWLVTHQKHLSNWQYQLLVMSRFQ